jgi:periplasmic protein TonB
VSRSRLRGGGLVLLSLTVHAVAIVGISVLALRAPVVPLFVDLTQDHAGVMEQGAGARAASPSRPAPPGDRAAARTVTTPSSGAPGLIAPAPAATRRPGETRASPSSPALSAPPSNPGAPDAVAPAPAVVRAAPGIERPDETPPTTVATGPVAPDSAGEAKPGAAGTPAGGTAPGPSSGRAAGTVSEAGGAGAGAGVSASGGARLALVLPGDGRGGAPAEYGPYLARFRRSVEDALVYPLAARRQGLAGRVELDVLLEPDGRVTAVEVHASSSHGVLDEAGIAAVRSLPPMPFPEGLPRRPLRIRLPLDFQLR